MRWFGSPRRSENEVEALHKRVERLTAVVSRIETEWGDTKDQVRRSYQRLEAAARKAEPRVPSPPPDPERELAARASLDPFSRKLLDVRSSSNADSPGLDESAG